MATTPDVNFLSGVLGGSGGKANYEPQRQNNALMYIVGVGGQQENVLTLSLSAFPLPKVTQNPIEIGYLNEKRKFAGNPTFDDLSVTFNDYIDVGTADALLLWRHQCYDPNRGTVGLASSYKKSGWVTLFSPDGDPGYNREYTLIGIWPSMFDPGEIDHQGEDVVRITCTFTIDKAYPSKGFPSVPTS